MGVIGRVGWSTGWMVAVAEGMWLEKGDENFIEVFS